MLGIQLRHCLINQGLILGNAGKVTAITQHQRLFNPIFQMPMGRLNRAVLVGDAAIIPGRFEPIVMTEFVIQAG